MGGLKGTVTRQNHAGINEFIGEFNQPSLQFGGYEISLKGNGNPFTMFIKSAICPPRVEGIVEVLNSQCGVFTKQHGLAIASHLSERENLEEIDQDLTLCVWVVASLTLIGV